MRTNPKGRPLYGPLKGKVSSGILDNGNTWVDDPKNDPARYAAARKDVERAMKRYFDNGVDPCGQ